MNFGLITEGVTDQAVLENILIGYFGEDDIDIKPLQPLPDFSRSYNPPPETFGSWVKVLNYCRSTDFLEAFQFNQYLVIQIDTDHCHEQGFNINRNDNPDTETIIERVRERFYDIFKQTFDEQFLQNYQDRILLAIAVEATECWLLPIHYQDKIKGSTKNCINRLENKLKENIKKEYRFYDKISRPFLSQIDLLKFAESNPSFDVFVKQLSKLQTKND